MIKDLVSIMMPAYNAEEYIGQAIESVLSQSYPNWELIIVNDGSTDKTGEIAAKYTDPRIKIVNQPNGGEPVARNKALENSSGMYIAFLDADDLFLDCHLELTMRYLLTHPYRDGVYTDGYYCDDKLNSIQTLQSWRRGPFEGNIFEEVVRASDVFGPPICVVLKRDLIEEHQLRFDPGITIGPDWDFFTQYSAHANFGYIDEITCSYRIHQTNVTVRTGTSRRAMDLAKCRMKAIKLEKFNTCSIDVKVAVFYDLLVNHFNGFPEHQSQVIQWDEFKALPITVQANLLRFVASKLILDDSHANYARSWLSKSRHLNPYDLRGLFISTLYNFHPKLCKIFLGLRGVTIQKNRKISPFGDRI